MSEIRFELTTSGFSVHRSTAELLRLMNYKNFLKFLNFFLNVVTYIPK